MSGFALSNIDERIAWLKEKNEAFSKFYSSADESGRRRLYRAQHPTAIMAFKCMDGRIHIPVMTGMPSGIIQPQRQLGGIFDLGWPFLSEVVHEWVDYNIDHNAARCLMLITYHYSKSNEHRGCAGFEYKTQDAHDYTWKFRAQVERVYGKEHSVVYPLIIGIETDEDAFTFLGDKGEIKIVDHLDKTEDELKCLMEEHYPDMHRDVLRDLMPLVLGNAKHVKEIRDSDRPVVEIEHGEWMLGLGRGFDWLHEPNLALIVGPYSPNLAEPIIKALGLIEDNMKRGRIGSDGFVLMTSAPFRHTTGFDRFKAIEKARSLNKFAVGIAIKHYPDLAQQMRQLTVIINENNKLITEI
ncbi:MAG: hypothetical protein WCO55_00195 [Candidatus Falkowbacteria bacterium]